MSTDRPVAAVKRLTVPGLLALKGQRPIVALTAYTAPMADILDPHVDILLVGDSLGMVLYGEESTLSVTLEDMIRHGRAVAKTARRACVIVDMPFGSYQASREQAYLNCARVLKETGCSAVKLEGGEELAETVAYLTQRAIPVMSHIGLMPQYVHAMGGYRWQGRDAAQRDRILQDARALEEAGAFSLLLEGIDAGLAREITRTAAIPTIGIGAGPACDGQILVTEDMAGLFTHTPKFVHRYGDMRGLLQDAVRRYLEEVTNGVFPSQEHSYTAGD